MRVVWTRAAIRDLLQIRRYVEGDNPPAASRVAVQILKSVNRLAVHPQVGWIGPLSGIRELIISKTPYVIRYRVQAETIELLRVIHSRQQRPASKRRPDGALQRPRKPCR
ncbi:MAG: type II toxin-antitoxin system RelE/ParE family toxin [Thermodesulfobacteriota bacterium]